MVFVRIEWYSLALDQVNLRWSRERARIDRAFSHKFEEMMQERLDLIIDCRLFSDPNAGPLRAHDGRHPDIQARVTAAQAAH